MQTDSLLLLCLFSFFIVNNTRILWRHFSGGRDPVKGDFLVIAAATLYAISNTSEVSKCLISYSKYVMDLGSRCVALTSLFLCYRNFFVKKADRVELMSFVGLFGAIIGAIQMYPSNEKG